MAKDLGETGKGVHCVRCERKVQWHEKKRIAVIEYQKTDVAIRQRETVIDRFNLCNDCYKEFNRLVLDFIG